MTHTFRTTISCHWGALLLGGLLVMTYAVPLTAPYIAFGEGYHGIAPEVSDDDYLYSARVQEVLDGHPFIGNPYLYEYKNAPPQQVFLAEFLLAQPLRLFGMRAVDGRILYALALPFVAFLLTYVVLYQIIKKRLWALIIAVLPFFYLLPFEFMRPISPQFNFIFFLTFYLILLCTVEGKYSKITTTLGVINFGFLFYIYPYYWVYFTILIALLMLVYFFFDRKLLVPLGIILVGGVVLASWYFYYTYQASLLPWYEESLTRLGMIYSHFPSGILTLGATLPVLILFGVAFRTKTITLTKETIFMVASMIAVIIAVNSHIITGVYIHHAAHYYRIAYFIAPFAFAYLIHIFLYSGDGLRRLRRGMLTMAVVVIVVSLVGYTTIEYVNRFWNKSTSDAVLYLQNYQPALDWLNTHAAPESVVFANREISKLVPLYTSQNVFFERYSHYFIMPDDEVFLRFAAQNYFEDLTDAHMMKFSRDFYGARHVSAYYHAQQGNKVRRMLGFEPIEIDILPIDALARVRKVIDDTRGSSFERSVKKFRVDFIVWDRNRDPHWKIDEQLFLEKVFDSGDIFVYRVI